TCALTVQDGLNRNDAVNFVAGIWLQRDANAARDWITNSSALTAEQKTHLLSQVAPEETGLPP
ncbi:MAG TPA: hypothetical protein VGH90_11555, partial [Chthoniobacteraceae bacterium]